METRARDVSERKRIDDDCNDVEMTERMMIMKMSVLMMIMSIM